MRFTRIQALSLVAVTLVPIAGASPKLLGAPPAEPVVQAPSRPRLDQYGDPLPEGAAMRLGTVRYRQVESIAHIAYASDGRLVFTDNGETQIQIWDARDGKKLGQIDTGPDHVIDQFALSPDGKTIMVSEFNFGSNLDRIAHRFQLIDLATGRKTQRTESAAIDLVQAMVFTHDGRTVAILDGDGKLLLWDIATGQLRRQEIPTEADVSAATLSSGAAGPVVAISSDHSISIVSMARPEEIRKISIKEMVVGNCLALSPDGTLVAASLLVEDEIRLWRVSDGTLFKRLKIRDGSMPSRCAFSTDGKTLVVTGFDHAIDTYDTAAGKVRFSLSASMVRGSAFAFSPDGKTLAATGNQQTLHFWDMATGKDRLATPDAHLGSVKTLAFLPDGKTLISGSEDQTVRIWDLTTGRPTKTLPHDDEVSTLSVSANGSLLASASEFDGKVRVWDLKTLKVLRMVEAKLNDRRLANVQGLTIDAEDSTVVVALDNGVFQRWKIAAGQADRFAKPDSLMNAKLAPVEKIMRTVFSPDGRTDALLSGFQMQLVDFASGEVRFKSPAKLACAFSPDGRSLAVNRLTPAKRDRLADLRKKRVHLASFQNQIVFVATDASVALLDAQTGQPLGEIFVPDYFIESLAYSPDGKLIAVGAKSKPKERGIVRVFRIRDRREILTVEPPCHSIPALAFSPDGKRIAAGLEDTSIVLWDLKPTD